ncbi:MAG: uracil-DNA glycosylase [Simkaniaceae bacterium]|nr:uracil-DNA glycosylase [Simkaniaceae bacterium]
MSSMSIEKSWGDQLKEEMEKGYIASLKQFLLQEEQEGHSVFPDKEMIFYAFKKTPFEKVKVVILGQDPYHGRGQAHGLSFSVKGGIKIPPSLRNIYQERERDLGIPPSSEGCLEKWADQGVLLLNSTLTVREKEPMSHHGKGWELFTDAVIKKLAERKDPLVFLLWGKSAASKCDRFLESMEHPHLILKAPHPSPYSASSGFFGCRHFSKTNESLKKWGKTPIDWGV